MPRLGLLFPLVLVAVPFTACKDDKPQAIDGDGGGVADAGTSDARGDGQPAGAACRGRPLPTGQHFVPEGLCAGLLAFGPPNVRAVAFAPNGDLFAANYEALWILRDEDGDGFFGKGEIHRWATTGGDRQTALTTSVHIDAAAGFVYSGVPTGVRRWPYAPGAASGGDGEDVVVGQPSGGHSTHTAHVFDGFLYVQSGSASNNINGDGSSPEYDTNRSLIKRFSLASFTAGKPFDWSAGEVVSVGLRNTNGFARDAAGRIFGVVNGMDNILYKGVDVHDENPGEQIVEIAAGKRYGFPFCFTAQRVVAGGDVIPPGTQLHNIAAKQHDDAWCAANSDKPVTFVQAHSAPLDILFFNDQPGGGLPERWRGGAFVALHGSWNRAPSTGHKVVWVPFDANGRAPMPTSTATETTFPYEIVFGGGSASAPKDGEWLWQADDQEDTPRPSGVAISPIDGSLYIASDDGQGAIYRVALRK